MMFHYEDCGVVVAVSNVEGKIFIAFRGTSNNVQLADQFLGLFRSFKDFPPSGGQVTAYNKNAHDALYPCVKSLVEDLLAEDNSVTVTGHSLGGAQAQLTAVNLISDGLVSSRDSLQVYTVRSPRVGDRDFAYNYDLMVDNSWRIVNRYDPVPQIIPIVYY